MASSVSTNDVAAIDASLQSQVVVRVVTVAHAGEQFQFDRHNTLVVGRAEDAQWRLLNDPYFSRYQFRIEANPPECRLIDLNSTNGTHVNGVRVSDAWLKDGDRIECGDTIFEVSVIEPPGAKGPTTLERPGPLETPATQEFQPSPAAPRRLADFEITRELGRGAMGIVYHAVQRPSGREAAVKLIRPATVPTPDAIQLFLREASILSQLRHPRIVEYLTLGLHQGQMYLAMEYLPALDFHELLRTQSRPKQVRLACEVMMRMLEALQFAHERDVVHRDVKPSNILVYRLGEKLHCKLADFGLAKNYLNAGFSSISHENEVRGTLGYMAPEQLINCRFAKPACDIYGVGACLYSFLSGKLPHDLDTGPCAVALILNSPPAPLAQRCPDLPTELAQTVDRALAREPSNRFSSAAHMRKALEPFARR